MTDLHALPIPELFAHLKTSESGLDEEEAVRRLRTYGPNEIESHIKKNYLKEYLSKYTQFFALLLEAAAILSFIANRFSPGEGYDILGYAIFGAVIINATFSFWQEYKADKTMEELLKLVPALVTVKRGGKVREIKAKALVPGDILIIEEGDRVGADTVLTASNALMVNNASLTGESRPVRRSEKGETTADILDARNVVFAGTTVVSGNCSGVVFATGKMTQFGRIAELTVNVKKRSTPMQREITRITRILTFAAVLAGSIFFVLGYLSGQGVLIASIFALSLIVANVPEGMLPTITLSLSIASRHMAARNALIKNLDSAQTLGSATVICTDKTGTITRNEMTVKKIYLASGEEITITGEGYFQEGEFHFSEKKEGSEERLKFLLTSGMLNCRAKIEEGSLHGDPTELSIIAAANKLDLDESGYEHVEEIPFTSERKMMSTICRKQGPDYTFTKGAVEILLPRATHFLSEKGEVVPFSEERKAAFIQNAEAYERDAFRVLGFAFREGRGEDNLVMLGLVGIMDLPRPEVIGAVAKCKKAGIKVFMLTGDNPLTAGAIAERIGLEVDKVFSGDEIRRIPDQELKELLIYKNVLFARMRSEQKLRIATLLQENGEVVAMTGDGVNDAPALRKADIGISMGIKGTEVAKEAADIILLDDNFASIVAAIEEGRTVYFNIKKFVTYILSSNVPEIVPYILWFFLAIPLPLTVILILSIDLGTDMVPGLALGSEASEEDIMDRPPVGKNERILDFEVFKRGYFFLGIIEAMAAMFAFLGFLFLNGWAYGDLSITGSLLHKQAMTMTLLGAVSCQLLNVWTLRSWENSAFERGFFSNHLLIVAMILEIAWIWAILNVGVVQYIFNTAAVPAQYLLLLVPFPILLFISHELYKWRIRKRGSKRNRKNAWAGYPVDIE
ncbi:MAG TPA: cation-transporting P-type ATPase [Methanoregulaceae archaeon]|nr:cation-transporting P-type ATPase [Methanoregulaceae archaeon]